MRCFDFFRFRTAIELAGPFDRYGIWNTIMLQAAHADSTILHATLALGALHESFANHQDPHAATCEYAVQHYNRAIERVIKLDFASSADNFDIVLMTSIIFSAFESLRGHLKLALTHIASGAKILAEIDPKTGSPRKGFLPRDIFIPTFTRLENQITEIDEKSPGPKIKSLPKRPLPLLPERFAVIIDAQIAFDCFLNCLWRLLLPIQPGDPLDESIGKTQEEIQRLIAYFSDWCTLFDQSGFPETDPAVLILRTNMQQLHILRLGGFGTGEMVWDAYNPEFEKLLGYIDQLMTTTSYLAPNDPVRTANSLNVPGQHSAQSNRASKPTFTFNLGIIAPLYFTSTRCRDPLIRRRAMCILSNCNRKEGIWDSSIAAGIAERIIFVEESNAIRSPVSHASQIPLNSRVAESDVFFGTGREGKIRYRMGCAAMEEPITEPQLEDFVW